MKTKQADVRLPWEENESEEVGKEMERSVSVEEEKQRRMKLAQEEEIVEFWDECFLWEDQALLPSEENYDENDEEERKKWVVYRLSEDPERQKLCPAPVRLCDYADKDVSMAPEVIQGLLRWKEKMLVTGASKSGKSFLLMELAIALANGSSWLGFSCRRVRVLFLNVEMEHQAAVKRMQNICANQGIDTHSLPFLSIQTVRGTDMDLKGLKCLLENMADRENEISYDVLIIDPVYKLLSGDENSTTSINELARLTDWICQTLKLTVIYSHHHSKGAKGNVRAMDRSSGSGVFARDADAILDLIELDVPEAVREMPENKEITVLRMESVLRDYPRYEPKNLIFRYPVHEVDTEGLLSNAGVAGAYRSNLSKSSKRVPEKVRKQAVREAYEELSMKSIPVELKDLAKQMGITERGARNRLKDLEDEFWVRAGLVGRIAG